ncbi:hypothetical protein BKA59DRAFT_516736 [Fusarium tricinctum]|uniref:Uncharacterized protein n=1 Tax=Fusarium tricinctum TaxID=61284 RepID=A0A8K0RMV2_9HYPO|nr:hypothetical protein BKA59DRAFT_516736 [Fusarium tricinctum]
MPSIEARINLPPIFDMDLDDPFIITVELILHHHSSNTFRTKEIPLFNGKVMNKGGLTFINTATGIETPRNTIVFCEPGPEGPLRVAVEDSFTSLRPGEKYIIEGSMYRTYISFDFGPNGSPEEIKAVIKNRPKAWDWWHAENLEEGSTYRIGIDQNKAIKRWLEGNKKELLSKLLTKRTDDKMKSGPIFFHVIQPAEFIVKKPE